jgi:predicted dehydrogenase
MGYDRMMKILVVGCGSIGTRHIGNLLKIKAGEILACDLDQDRLAFLKKKYGNIVFDNLDNALDEKPDVVFICTPPSSHINIALKAVKNNAHVFIEKPLSNTLKGVDDVLRIAEKNNLYVFVGYNFRFHKGMQLVKKFIEEGKIGKILSARAEFGQYLPDWRPWQDYTKSYTARKDLGGGIILDGSHEIDYLQWIVGDMDSVFCFADKLSSLDVETEDVAGILLRSKKGAICEIHLDFIRPEYARNCEIIGERGIIIWDFSKKIVKIFDSEKQKWGIIKTPCEVNDMYIDEIKHVMKSIKGGEKPSIDGYDGKKTLTIALAAKQSAASRKMIHI